MTTKIEELEPQREDAKPVFKPGYAYTNRLGDEYCMVAFDHNNEGNPILVMGIPREVWEKTNKEFLEKG